MKRVITEVYSDLSQEPDAETVTFAWDDRSLEIDLTSMEFKELEELLAPYVAASRPAMVDDYSPRRQPRRRQSAGTTPPGYNTVEVRQWARENGYVVNDRGRIPQNVIDAYLAAN